MAVWSSFRRAFSGAIRASDLILNRVARQNAQQTRHMGGHAKFNIQPTRWQWHKFKDLVHFYTMVGAIPLGLITLYANLFIGPAQLAPIPEGYVPQEHEYYRHPITRFFQKYIMESEQMAYERHLHGLWEHYDRSEFRRIDRMVRELIEARQDYKQFYYLPVDTQSAQVVQQETYEMYNERGEGK